MFNYFYFHQDKHKDKSRDKDRKHDKEERKQSKEDRKHSKEDKKVDKEERKKGKDKIKDKAEKNQHVEVKNEPLSEDDDVPLVIVDILFFSFESVPFLNGDVYYFTKFESFFSFYIQLFWLYLKLLY